jgi:beta-lactamase class A
VKRAAFLSCAGGALIAVPAGGASSVGDKVRAIAGAMPGRMGVYAAFASGAPLVAYDATNVFPTASIIKVLVMATAYAMEEIKPGSLSAKITFRNSDLISGSDFMDQADDGQQFTVHELIVPMIQVSDNTAANLLITHYGITTINAIGRYAGMYQTRLARKFVDSSTIVRHNDNVSTPADMGHLLYLIERGAHEGVKTIVSPEHCRAMVAIMLGQTDRDGIPAALPRGTPVANKTGEIQGTLNDVAIVEPFGNSPFILAIMTVDADDFDAAYTAIHKVTRAAFAAAEHGYA